MISLLSVVFVVFLALRRLILGPEAEGVFTLVAIAFFLLGVALFGVGLVGEYVGRIYDEVRHRPRYIVGSVLEQQSPYHGVERRSPELPESQRQLLESHAEAPPP